MKNVLILGANSGLARALVRKLAGPQVQLLLAGRNQEELAKTAADVQLRTGCPEPAVLAFDAGKLETHAQFWHQVLGLGKSVDEVYLFFGVMHDQKYSQGDLKLALDMLTVNFIAAVSILEPIAAYMEGRKAGLIVAVSSVAGDRGRQSNYFYGSAKAGLTAYLQGLRNRLAPAGVHVLTVKPGFVDTAMTRDLKKGLLMAKPETVGKGILKAARKRKNVVYLPWFWRCIMLVIKLIPEGIFKRMKL